MKDEPLDEVFSEDEPKPLEDSTGAEEAEEVTEEETEEETETEAQAEEEEESEGDGSPPEPTTVPLTALLDEREKRQNLERRLEAIEKSQQPDEETVSVFDNEEEALNQRLTRAEQKIRTELFARDVKKAERKLGKEVVDNAIDWFNDAAKSSPALLKRFSDAFQDPEEIVDMHKEHLKVQQLSDPKYVESLEREIEKKVLARLKKEAPEEEDTPTPSLASTAKSGGEEAEEDSLDAVTLGV